MTRERFDEIIHSQYRKLYMIAIRILKNKPEAEDAVQEVFMKMWTIGDKLDEYTDIEAVAVIMLKNKCIDVVRRRKFNDGEEVSSSAMHFENPDSPYDQMVANETNEIVRKIISGLSPNFRKLVQLREIDGFSYEEIASMTGANVNSIRVSVSRARQIIKEEYLKHSYERGNSEKTAGEVL
ncbi:MAG: sigma-70 family RNA polymerase sigma factor [Bacteroidales bacterium]